MIGEKQLDLFQGLCYRFPTKKILLLAWVQIPLLFLMIKVHIEGMALMLWGC